jgi:hypothetical protein
MECHHHAGTPAAAQCANCHVFMCRPCVGLNQRPAPAQCSDCLLDGIKKDSGRIVGRLIRAIVVAAVVLVVAEVASTATPVPLAAAILGVIVAYLLGSLALRFPWGPIIAPWILVTELQHLDELRDQRTRVLGVREAPEALEPVVPPEDEQPPGPRSTPKLGPRTRSRHRRRWT